MEATLTKNTHYAGSATQMPFPTSSSKTHHSTQTEKHMKAKAYYIQRRDGKDLETVDEFDNRKEAVQALKEYRMCDTSAGYYISTRACKSWGGKDD